MKGILAVMMALALCLPMVSCASGELPAPAENGEETQWEIRRDRVSDMVSDAEGRLLSSYTYEFLHMDPAEDAPEDVVEMAACFNAKMEEQLEACLETGVSLDEWAANDPLEVSQGRYYTHDVKADYVQSGEIISVSFESTSYTGGSHGDLWCRSFIFDLARKNFINPAEIADDPLKFRDTVAQLLLDQIQQLEPEIRDNYFSGYEAAVAEWNNYCVTFGKEIQVEFSPYVLGTYSIGSQVFSVPYQSVELGSGGQARLGIQSEK